MCRVLYGYVKLGMHFNGLGAYTGCYSTFQPEKPIRKDIHKFLRTFCALIGHIFQLKRYLKVDPKYG